MYIHFILLPRVGGRQIISLEHLNLKFSSSSRFCCHLDDRFWNIYLNIKKEKENGSLNIKTVYILLPSTCTVYIKE